jgi:signal transduction histidine kinase
MGIMLAELEKVSKLTPGSEEPVIEFKYRMRNSAGVYKWFHSYSTVFERNAAGEIESVVNVSVNITGQEEAELSLARKNMELEKSNKSLQEYAYVASHDLKEPLRKIATFTDRLRLLLRKGQTKDTEAYMEKIIASVRRMTTMVDDLLAVSTIEGNKAFEVCDLNEVLADVVSTLDQRMEERRARVESARLPEARVVCSQFRQLFQNLLSNSLKFCRKGVPPHITIQSLLSDGSNLEQLPATKAPKYLQISVIDNGIGFEEEYAENVFTIFRQLHGKHEYGGTGIGLAICKKIVENHNGIIYAHSEPGKGATFTLVIPQH